jgi:ureidoacrylate peracid hydrolase
MQLAATDCALLIVDMQISFCAPEGGCARAGLPVARLRPAIEPCSLLIKFARRAGAPILYTRYVLAPDYADAGLIVNELWPELRAVGALRAGTADIEIIPELYPLAGDIVIDKNRPSAFLGTNLEDILKRLRAKRLVVCGVTTNCCVESTVRDAGQRDYETFVVREAVAEFDDERHRHALNAMERLFAKVVSLEDVATAWAQRGVAPRAGVIH